MKHHIIVLPDLLAIYRSMGLTYSKLMLESESQDYGACSFEMNNKIIKFRVAKITPTKTGQFVTFWKRIGNGPIVPYDSADRFDFLVVSVQSGKNWGQFVFPKSVLLKQGLLSKDGNGGKRAMRIYPPWDLAGNQQAKKTQAWQKAYFFSIQPTLDVDQATKLFL